MKIRELMVADPITVTAKATVQEALEILKTNAIRHLPVVGKGKQLKGFITLADLRAGLIPAMVSDLNLADLMIKNPITVGPEDDVENAARLIYRNKIGGMPVTQKGRVVGIITESDILRAFVDMMGLLTASSRIDVEIKDKETLNRCIMIINDNGGDIINVGTTARMTGKRTYFFRLEPCKTKYIKNALEKEGFDVCKAMD